MLTPNYRARMLFRSVKTCLTGANFLANIDQMNNKESRDGT